MPIAKITAASIPKLAPPVSGNLESYFDPEFKGFGVYVTKKGVKSFFVRGRVEGRQKTFVIGRCNVYSVKDARNEAQKALALIAQGVDPSEDKRRAREKKITLLESLERMLEENNSLKAGTRKTYRSHLGHLSDWMNKPIGEISPEAVVKRHATITKKAGKAPANNAMRTLRLVYNFALIITKGKIPDNPVVRLTASKSLHKIPRRKTIIESSQLNQWYMAVSKLENPSHRVYLLLLLFTGLRREEALRLKGGDVNFEEQRISVKDTKNGSEHVLPMTEFICHLLQEQCNRVGCVEGYVFPGQGKSGAMSAPTRSIWKVEKEVGFKFCLHDLRRTFSTIAEGVVSYSVLKRLLNHSTVNDVTQGYLIISLDDLRLPMKKIEIKIKKLCSSEEA